MKEFAEQTYWISERGVIVTLPPHATDAISQCDGQISPQESMRLKIIDNCKILKNRYPSAEDGYAFMETVDPEWRQELYAKAEVLAKQFAFEARDMQLGDVAIVLFGSVAKNLSKSIDNEDPSNLDIVVIADFDEESREDYLNRIRPYRDSVGQQIGNNVGVQVQTPDVLSKNSYSNAINLISSSARPLYDPTGIWSRIESSALQAAAGLKRYRTETPKKSKAKII